MVKNVNAIYEDGAFRPIDGDLSLEEGARVRLTVERVADRPEENVLELAARVYAGLSDEDVAEIEEIAAERRNFFSK